MKINRRQFIQGTAVVAAASVIPSVLAIQDHSSVNRNFPFTASGSLNFNDNLVNDSGAKYWLFFTNDSAGDSDIPIGLSETH